MEPAVLKAASGGGGLFFVRVPPNKEIFTTRLSFRRTDTEEAIEPLLFAVSIRTVIAVVPLSAAFYFDSPNTQRGCAKMTFGKKKAPTFGESRRKFTSFGRMGDDYRPFASQTRVDEIADRFCAM